MKTKKQPNLWPSVMLRLVAVMITGLFLLGVSGRSIAANVNWGAATNVTGNADVATNGTLVYAYTQSGVSATCNGVTFAADSSATSLGGGNVTLSGFIGGVYVGFDVSGLYSSDYHNLINGGAYGLSGGSVTLNNLTPGHQYLVQFWVVDNRGNANGWIQVLDNQTTLTYIPGQYAIGTFTPTGTSQVIQVAANASMVINAIQVRDITVPVAWGAGTTLTGDADVSTNGTLVYAYTESGVAATCNGVTFAADSSATSLGGGNVTLSGFIGGVYAGFDPSGSFSSDYHNLITGGAYGATDGFVTLNNLTKGRQYLVQFWVADYRGDGVGRTTVLDNQTTLNYNPGQYAIGTFTANDTSQLIQLASAALQFNAIQVRDVTDVVVTRTLTYNGNGATGGSVPVDGNSPYTNGATVTVLGNTGGLTLAGKVFTNWNTAANGSGTTYNPGATFAITQPTTLYAQYVYTPVTWGSAAALTGDADVVTNGTLVYAYAESGVSATCNGVTFTGEANQTSLGSGNVTLSGFFGGVYAGYDTSSFFSPNYHNLITGGAYGGNSPGLVTLNNLTSGRKYLVQLWVVDYRGDGFGRTVVLDNQTTLTYNPPQYAIGTFTANGASQFIQMNANASLQINAIQVRDVTDVPPPAITLQPNSRTNYAGNRVSFTVAATGATSYQWYFNTNTPVAGATTSTLNLQNVQLTNAGTYHVVVANIGGAVTSSVVRLTVLTNLTVGGDFESPVTLGFDNFGGGSTGVFGWTVDTTPPDGVSLGLPNEFSIDNGSQNLQLTGASGYSTGGGISQTIATTPGATYRISIDVASRQNDSVTGNFDFGGQSHALVASSRTFTTLTWRVVASGSSTVIDITGSTSSAASQLIIDNVRVAPAPANRAPVAQNISLGAQVGVLQTLPIVGAAKNAPTDADADELTISAVTQGTNGGVVTISGNNVTYSNNVAGMDSFTYTVSDGYGGTDTKTVTVYVSGVNNQQTPTITFTGGNYNVQFWGVPGTAYTVQFAAGVNGPWSDLTPAVTARTSQPYGQISFIDTNAPGNGTGFYRLKP